MDEDFGPDIDFSALEQAEQAPTTKAASVAASPVTDPSAPKIKQPTPQVRTRSGPSSILVSTRQKGNPILALIRSLPWEYSDIPSDYVLGNTTCALFLSLKYHRLHPEYIYGRIRAMAHKYNLRILLTMVDIHNHEDSLKELSKTSLINNLTLILCWSAQEAARYLELFKSYEHAEPTSIRAHQATSYRDKLVEFITVPRSINKTDAVGLVSAFGSIRAAVNARPEEISAITGWGEKKVQRWCETVRQPFRIRKAAAAAARRGRLDDNNNSNNRDGSGGEILAELGNQGKESSANSRQEENLATLQNKEDSRIEEDDDDENSTRRLLKEAEVEFAQNGGWKTGGQRKGRAPDNTSQHRSDAANKTAGKRAAPEDSVDSDDDDEEEALFLAAAAAEAEAEAEAEGDDGPSPWILNNKLQQNSVEATKGRSLLSSMNSSSSSSTNKKIPPPPPSSLLLSQAAAGTMNEGMISALARLREK